MGRKKKDIKRESSDEERSKEEISPASHQGEETKRAKKRIRAKKDSSTKRKRESSDEERSKEGEISPASHQGEETKRAKKRIRAKKEDTSKIKRVSSDEEKSKEEEISPASHQNEETKPAAKTKVRRTFCANGKVEKNSHFFVDPSEWNTEELMPRVERGEYFTLLAPSQTGKTTRAEVFTDQLRKNGYFPL
jgi:flagellar biosynthesis GTPase FlhF